MSSTVSSRGSSAGVRLATVGCRAAAGVVLPPVRACAGWSSPGTGVVAGVTVSCVTAVADAAGATAVTTLCTLLTTVEVAAEEAAGAVISRVDGLTDGADATAVTLLSTLLTRLEAGAAVAVTDEPDCELAVTGGLACVTGAAWVTDCGAAAGEFWEGGCCDGALAVCEP
jgi:hypothetical protein